jgi:hypothetical protein
MAGRLCTETAITAGSAARLLPAGARSPDQRYPLVAGSRSAKVRPLAVAPIAVIVHSPAPPRLTLAMIWALCRPEPDSS